MLSSEFSNKTLLTAVARADSGLIDADLDGGVIKQRIARPGKGKSGGYRTIIIFRQGEKAFFVYGYAKSRCSNIEQDEVEVFRKAARELLALADMQIMQLIETGALTEVTDDDEA